MMTLGHCTTELGQRVWQLCGACLICGIPIFQLINRSFCNETFNHCNSSIFCECIVVKLPDVCLISLDALKHKSVSINYPCQVIRIHKQLNRTLLDLQKVCIIKVHM